jgi:hypothetical protein
MRRVQVRKDGKRFQQADKAAACSSASDEKAAETALRPHGGPLTSWREQAEQGGTRRARRGGHSRLLRPRETGRWPLHNDSRQPGNAGDLASPGPLTFRPVTTRASSRTWNDLIAACHYPGCTPLAGAQLRYLIRAGHAGTVAAISFGASAWKCAARDTLTGWDPPARETRLHLITGNARFLILPHVRIPHLASAILGRVTRRLPADWRDAYGYAPVLAETFAETYRFSATSYRAANWIHADRTQGRGKPDRNHQHALPVKDVYLYPCTGTGSASSPSTSKKPAPPARNGPPDHRPTTRRADRILTIDQFMASGVFPCRPSCWPAWSA